MRRIEYVYPFTIGETEQKEIDERFGGNEEWWLRDSIVELDVDAGYVQTTVEKYKVFDAIKEAFKDGDVSLAEREEKLFCTMQRLFGIVPANELCDVN